jgi:hypothetical protein
VISPIILARDYDTLLRNLNDLFRQLVSTLTGLVNRTVAGSATISGSATSVPVALVPPQPDTNYVVTVGNPIAIAGTPALTTAYATTFSTTGFVIQVAAAPGVGNTYFVSWNLTRLNPIP